ncbi:hypothetical protein N665_0090s0010 [Sinapis alba]|nr:hypothetical protein N665_0090s0009 [Sinapis alba]KAF8109827.1 hypothetical protein N665_0090s0010 [Sinapis alba]
MEQNVDVRIRKTLRAMRLLSEKANEIVERCGAEVGVICYAHDAVSPLFHGNPSLKAVVERHNAENPRTSLETIEALDQALANIVLENLSPHELRTLRSSLLSFHEKLANNNNQA